ncbi:MAG: OmpH family outer membrane protein [Psychroflexus halocasei]|uniref:OmpH family outer membrane protein n=1 Tax=Psychroflexus sp. S27 TaxID=1982757 RepID=UPI000C2A68BD|nr:OmpH family outer membrane protein [Psychroflexus sp. S27]
MKKIFILAIALIGFQSMQAQSKVGTINNEYILSQMSEIKDVEKQLMTYGEELDNNIQEKYNAYTEAITKYNEDKEELTKVVRVSREKKITEMENDLQKLQQNSSKLLQIRQDELMRPLYQEIGNALEKIVKRENYTQVINENQSLIYIDPDYDLTIKVMKEIGLEIPDENPIDNN